MPIYHFHDADGVRWNDAEGIDVADDQAAQLLATRFAGEMLQQQPHKLWEHGQWRVEVTDDRNIQRFTVIMIAIDAPRPGEVGGGEIPAD